MKNTCNMGMATTSIMLAIPGEVESFELLFVSILPIGK